MRLVPQLSSPSKMGRGTARRVVEGRMPLYTNSAVDPSVAFGATSPQLRCREEIS
jgi:hypothetical protein